MGEQGGSRFLIVEDDPSLARYLARLAERHGPVTLADTAHTAAQLVAEKAGWGALLIDVGLPDGSGLDVLARARETDSHVPALVLTGRADASTINAAYDLGASCIVKPIASWRVDRFLRTCGPNFASRLEAVVGLWRTRYHLSDAETEVLLRSAQGKTREDIATARRSSPLTVKKHVANLLQKTSDSSLHAAVEKLLRETSGA